MTIYSAIRNWKDNANIWQYEGDWYERTENLHLLHYVHRVKITQALESIVREVVLARPAYRRYEIDLDTSNICEFKESFGYGYWNSYYEEEFIDLFDIDYEFDFTLFECYILEYYFNVILDPLPPS